MYCIVLIYIVCGLSNRIEERKERENEVSEVKCCEVNVNVHTWMCSWMNTGTCSFTSKCVRSQVSTWTKWWSVQYGTYPQTLRRRECEERRNNIQYLPDLLLWVSPSIATRDKRIVVHRHPNQNPPTEWPFSAKDYSSIHLNSCHWNSTSVPDIKHQGTYIPPRRIMVYPYRHIACCLLLLSWYQDRSI